MNATSRHHIFVPHTNAGTATNVDTISLEELQHKLSAHEIVLLDALSTEEYRRAHIPGAMSLPPHLARTLAPIYAPDQAAEIVVYAADVESAEGRRLAERLHTLGYTNVRLFLGGKQKWMRFLLPMRTSAAA